MRIGSLAKRAGTTVPTIRFYESVGLLPRPSRCSGGQRTYGEDDVRRLTFIRRCRAFDFSIEQVRALTQVMNDPRRDCMEARDLAQQQLSTVSAKLAELKTLKTALTTFVQSCDRLCNGGAGRDCVVLQDLAATAAARQHNGQPC